MRLIDADALLKALNDYGLSYRADINGMIMSAPTIETSADIIRRKDVDRIKRCNDWLGIPSAEPSGDIISRQDAIDGMNKLYQEDYEEFGGLDIPECFDNDRANEVIKALPSADRPTLKQTDTMIIADALRYLIKDTERHEIDRTRAEELREQILQYGASMCHSVDDVPTVIRAKTFMRKEDFDKWAEDIKKQGENVICIPCDAEVVSADRQKGEWIGEDGNNVPLYNDGRPLRSCYCNQCHEWLVASDEYEVKGNFCPNCGADMRPEK